MFRPGTDKLPYYSMEEEQKWLHKLDANERSAKLPRKIIMDIENKIRRVETHRYPDMSARKLRAMLAEEYGLSMDQISLGNGSSELIAAVCASFGGPERPIAYQWPSFSMYPIYAAMADSPAIPVPMDEQFQLSAEETEKMVKISGAKLLILCNPNNPTGSVIPLEKLREMIGRVSCPVLVDEAYMEYYGESCIPWLAEFPNLMVARTFSKAFGLAAARVGYLLASPELSKVIGKRLLPYHVNSFSLAAAEACFSGKDSVMIEVKKAGCRRDRLLSRIKKLNTVQVFPSATNFILVKVNEPAELYKLFADKGIGVRNFSYVSELKGCLRITIGTSVETLLAYECMKEYDSGRIAKTGKAKGAQVRG